MSATDAEFDEYRVRRIVAHCVVNGPPRSWRDLPADVAGVTTEAEVREATERVKAASRSVAEAAARGAARG